MSYLVAIGTSDDKNIDLKFGELQEFSIYRVEGREYTFLEKRSVTETVEKTSCEKGSCGQNKDSGCSGNGHACGGPYGVIERVEIISDCRCVLCAKVGFQAQKQFERKAISVFDIACSIEDALNKISFYYDKQDNHESLRK